MFILVLTIVYIILHFVIMDLSLKRVKHEHNDDDDYYNFYIDHIDHEEYV